LLHLFVSQKLFIGAGQGCGKDIIPGIRIVEGRGLLLSSFQVVETKILEDTVQPGIEGFVFVKAKDVLIGP